MVDRQARKILYDEAVDYLRGRTDKKQFISLYEKIDTADMAVWEIQDRIQNIPLIRASGSPPRLKRSDDRRHIVRMLVFALSDSEYAWPEERHDSPVTCAMIVFMLLAVPAMGLLWWRKQGIPLLVLAALFVLAVWIFDRIRVRRVRRWQLHGDIEAWPFLRLEDYERAAERYESLVEEDLPGSLR